MSIIFASVARKVATLATPEDAVAGTPEEGVASCICAVTSIQLRGTVLESACFVALNLWAMKEVLDILDVNGP